MLLKASLVSTEDSPSNIITIRNTATNDLLLTADAGGLRDTVLDWFQLEMSNRTFSVVVGDASSSVAPLTSGVPQGSNRSPLFFIYKLPVGRVTCRQSLLCGWQSDLCPIKNQWRMQPTSPNVLSIRNQMLDVPKRPPAKWSPYPLYRTALAPCLQISNLQGETWA